MYTLQEETVWNGTQKPLENSLWKSSMKFCGCGWTCLWWSSAAPIQSWTAKTGRPAPVCEGRAGHPGLPAHPAAGRLLPGGLPGPGGHQSPGPGLGGPAAGPGSADGGSLAGSRPHPHRSPNLRQGLLCEVWLPASLPGIFRGRHPSYPDAPRMSRCVLQAHSEGHFPIQMLRERAVVCCRHTTKDILLSRCSRRELLGIANARRKAPHP